MTAQALAVTVAANTVGLRVAPLAETIAAEAKQLRAAGASIVVVVSHAGGRCTAFTVPTDLSSCNQTEESCRSPVTCRRIDDVIVAGHAHSGMAHVVDGISIIEAYMGGRSFGRVDLVVDPSTRRIIRRRLFAPRDLCARVDPGTTQCDRRVRAAAASVRSMKARRSCR